MNQNSEEYEQSPIDHNLSAMTEFSSSSTLALFHCCHSNPIVYESLVPDFFCHRLASYNQAIGYFFVCSLIYLFICLSGDFLFAYSSICFLVHLFTYLLIYSFAYMCFRLSCSAKYNSG